MCGETDFGQGNEGPSTDYPYYPKEISSATGFVRLAAGEVHFVALKSDGTVWAVSRLCVAVVVHLLCVSLPVPVIVVDPYLSLSRRLST